VPPDVIWSGMERAGGVVLAAGTEGASPRQSRAHTAGKNDARFAPARGTGSLMLRLASPRTASAFAMPAKIALRAPPAPFHSVFPFETALPTHFNATRVNSPQRPLLTRFMPPYA
jgi:hypothetical protein